jgi:hypothetical protein
LFALPQALIEEVNKIDRNQLLNASLNDLQDQVVSSFWFDIPRLRMGEIRSLPPEDVRIDVSGDRSRMWRTPGPHYITGSRFTLSIPFDGDATLFEFDASSGWLGGPQGECQGNTVILKHERQDHDLTAVKTNFDDRIQKIQTYLETQRRDVERWNAELPGKVLELLEARKRSALQALNVAESLGYPLKRRDDAIPAAPVVRKRVRVQVPSPKAVPYTPEPTLAMQQYDEILQMIASLAVMLERSPSTFAGMGEEDLRNQLLVILNSNFEGQATGETFNNTDKTDILIREKDRNVFIAECKVWDGPKTLTGAIDQVLSYACWRDTKVAVILFNRRKGFSAVLAAIPDTVTQHPQCKRRLEYKAESGFRFLFGQKDDRNREMVLTVLAFDVPGPEDSSDALQAAEAKAEKPRRARRK